MHNIRTESVSVVNPHTHSRAALTVAQRCPERDSHSGRHRAARRCIRPAPSSVRAGRCHLLPLTPLSLGVNRLERQTVRPEHFILSFASLSTWGKGGTETETRQREGVCAASSASASSVGLPKREGTTAAPLDRGQARRPRRRRVHSQVFRESGATTPPRFVSAVHTQ